MVSKGSAEALGNAVEKLSTDAVKLRVIHSGVGAITETDVMLASASRAIVIGFNIRPEPKASALAEKRAAQLDRDAVLIAARGEASAAAARDREAGRALELFTTGLLELGAHNLDVLRQSFEIGRASCRERV